MRVALWYIPGVSRPSHLVGEDGKRNNDVIRDVGRINQDAHRRDFVAMGKQEVKKNRNNGTAERERSVSDKHDDEHISDGNNNVSGNDFQNIKKISNKLKFAHAQVHW